MLSDAANVNQNIEDGSGLTVPADVVAELEFFLEHPDAEPSTGHWRAFGFRAVGLRKARENAPPQPATRPPARDARRGRGRTPRSSRTTRQVGSVLAGAGDPPPPGRGHEPPGRERAGAHVSALRALRAKEDALWPQVAALDLRDLNRRPLISVNAKTSISVDFPIGHTCAPTACCAEHCYAVVNGAPAKWPKCLRKRLRNLRYIELTDPSEAAERLSKEFARKRRSWKRRGVELDYFRFNGTGDLFPAVIPKADPILSMGSC